MAQASSCKAMHPSHQIQLAYGKDTLTVTVPKQTQVLTPDDTIVPLARPHESILESLRNPIGSVSLYALIRKKRPKTVCIVVSDYTRPVPYKIILPPLLSELHRAGIHNEQITILIATGMHRASTPEERLTLFGQEILESYRVFDHTALDKTSLVSFTLNDISVSVNRRYVESDMKILTGCIEPHFMTGFSGGRKSICPGISGLDTMKYFHGPKLLESPFAIPGNLDHNPCHEFAVAVAKRVGVDFILNVLVNREQQITGVFSGDLDQAFYAGVQQCELQTLVTVEQPFEIVITTNGGYPLDQNFYQSVKGLVGALAIVKNGGTIICAAECSDGVGSPEFRKLLFNMQSPEQFIQMISAPDYFQLDQWEVEELIKVLRKVTVQFYSTGISFEELKRCHVQPISSVEAGINLALTRYGSNATIAVIPDGPYVLTKVKKTG
ncbi:MAG: nickel-dependent lactate racemase [bacterium]|nr:nickel-dependent lactate racemase [bacterium]